MARLLLIASLALGGAAACASAGTRPDEMTLLEHELAAARAGDPDLAREHRAAGQVLRDAEEKACAGLTERDRALEPFFRPSDVERVTVVYGDGDSKSPAPKGAVLVLRAASAPAPEFLRRRIACHSARVAVIGEVPEFGACPLALKGARALVRSGPTDVRVEILSDDADTADEILRRALSLTGVVRSSASAELQAPTERPQGERRGGG